MTRQETTVATPVAPTIAGRSGDRDVPVSGPGMQPVRVGGSVLPKAQGTGRPARVPVSCEGGTRTVTCEAESQKCAPDNSIPQVKDEGSRDHAAHDAVPIARHGGIAVFIASR